MLRAIGRWRLAPSTMTGAALGPAPRAPARYACPRSLLSLIYPFPVRGVSGVSGVTPAGAREAE